MGVRISQGAGKLRVNVIFSISEIYSPNNLVSFCNILCNDVSKNWPINLHPIGYVIHFQNLQ